MMKTNIHTRILRSHLLILLSLLLSAQTLQATSKAEADALYNAEQYQKAAAAYSQILKTQGVAAEIYYNLGNCYYKMDSIPLAILNYERAYVLDPGDNDIRNNLTFARGKTIDKVVPPSKMFFVTWWNDFTHLQSIDAWALQAVILFIISLVSLLVYFLSFNIRVRKVAFSLSMLLLAVVVLHNLAAYSQYSELKHHAAAIIMDSAVSVKSSPSPNSTDLFLIHEGSKVEILDQTMEHWYEIKFEEGKQGWIPANSVEVI